LTSFSKAELDEIVDGAGANKDQYVYFAYLRTKGEMLTGKPQVLRYDQKTGAILRSEVQLKEKVISLGSPDDVEFVDDYVLLSFHYNPSASSVVVLDQQLKIVELLYGFEISRVARNQIVMVENMMHFAPVHPERLEFVDLHTGANTELYPPKGDTLRERFALESEKHMPSVEVCKQLENDLCDPKLYDEDVSFLGSDGNGRFALVAARDASHATKKDEVPVTVASESALYIYQQGKSGWLYCEMQVSEDEAKALIGQDKNGYDSVKARCIPNLPVVADMTTAGFNPFPHPQRRAK